VSDVLVDVGVAMAALPGESESGDLHLVERHPGGVLVGVIDGLGHGSEAAEAARVASATVRQDPGGELPDLFVSSHGRLARSRGVVMSLARFSEADASMTWLGVGNVEGTLVRAGAEEGTPTESILLMGGVVGYQLPRLRPSTTSLAPGDTVILATDGIKHGFLQGLDRRLPPQELADRILADHARESDDALVLVARYLGPGS
jgi:negative regulator of sigma-B (phosphoserine phosphatase)